MRQINKLNNYLKLTQIAENDRTTVKIGKFDYIELPKPETTTQSSLDLFGGL